MRTWWVPTAIGSSASMANSSMPSTLYTNLALPSLAYRAQPPKRPPWAMITPLAPALGASTSAVTEKDLFLILTTLFSESRPIPG